MEILRPASWRSKVCQQKLKQMPSETEIATCLVGHTAFLLVLLSAQLSWQRTPRSRPYSQLSSSADARKRCLRLSKLIQPSREKLRPKQCRVERRGTMHAIPEFHEAAQHDGHDEAQGALTSAAKKWQGAGKAIVMATRLSNRLTTLRDQLGQNSFVDWQVRQCSHHSPFCIRF